MSKIIETFSTYLARIEKVQSQMKKPIVLSTDVSIPTLWNGEDKSIKKVPIAWPLYEHHMYYVVTVPAKKRVPRHSHQEAVFRFVVKGSLVINSIPVTEGMWFVVQANTPYEIDTETGYTTFAAYGPACLTDEPGGTHWIDDEGRKEQTGVR
jgi:hypothetical protein